MVDDTSQQFNNSTAGPRWHFGKVGIKLAYHGRLVLACVVAEDELIEALVCESLPRSVCGIRVDWVKEGSVGSSCFQVARGVAEHQYGARFISSITGPCQVLFLGAHLLAGD